jgi:octaprenyl-diphosphate synthase
LAAVVEFIHTATLLHDDVVDESDLRRGRRTANAVFGNAASVLVGDFLYSRSFQLMVELERMQVMRILADTTNRIAEGEVLQLLHVRNPDTDEAAYLRVVERKTAVLFAAATRLGALLAGADAATCDAMHEYGLNLGHAFQIADDVLDYAADAGALGKNLGDDLAEGKATLPLIHAIAHSDDATRARLRDAVEHGDVGAMPHVVAAIHATGGLEYSRGKAREFADAAMRALDGLPDNDSTAALRGLALHAVERDR